MRRFLGLIGFIVLASCSKPAGDNSSGAKPQGGSIAGVVREAGTDVPISSVNVFLIRTSDRTQVRANTDADGKFILEGLEPGRHLVGLVRDGYVVPGRLEISGYPFTLTAGQNIQNVEFHLVPAGTVSGHVVNADGTPANRVEVQFLQELYVMGKLQWSAVNRGGSARSARVETNERGEFRALGMDPGRYAIRFVPHETSVDSIVPGGKSSPPVLYPGVRDIGKAAMVEVKAGRETLLDDLKLMKEQRGWIRVTVFNESGESLEGFGDWQVEPVGWVGADYPFVEQRVVNDFHEIQPDVPGTYEITASWPTAKGQMVGRLRVPFQGAELSQKVVIQKASGKLVGHVLLEETAGAAGRALTGVEVSIGPDIPYFARSGPDGALLLPSVYPGNYKLGSVRGLPQGTFVSRVSQGPRDVLREGVVVSSETDIQVVVSPGAGFVEGKVVDSTGKPAHNALVALIPEGPLKERTDYYGAYHDTRTDQNGGFGFGGLTPGAYQAFAWSDVSAGGYRNADFMKPFAGKGTPVSVGPSGKVNLNLTALPIP